MKEFFIYLSLGFEHISDVQGFDHILFILTLCAVYRISEWKNVAILVSAFTIGHSVTLALSALKIIVFDAALIELLIPVTILFTSIGNLFYKPSAKSVLFTYNYVLALTFGLVHGMGFSNFFNALMGEGVGILFPLFAFNLGLELGQLTIVFTFFILYFLIGLVKKVNHQAWTQFFSGAGAGVSLVLIFERI